MPTLRFTSLPGEDKKQLAKFAKNPGAYKQGNLAGVLELLGKKYPGAMEDAAVAIQQAAFADGREIPAAVDSAVSGALRGQAREDYFDSQDAHDKRIARQKDDREQAEAQAKKDEQAQKWTAAREKVEAEQAEAAKWENQGPETLTGAQVPKGMIRDLRERGYPLDVAVQIAHRPKLTRMVGDKPLEEVADELIAQGVDVPDPTAVRMAREKYTEQQEKLAAQRERIKAKQAAEQPDWLEEAFGRWQDDTQENREGQLTEAEQRGSALVKLGETYGEDVTGSEGYKGLGEYRDEMRGIYDQGGLTDVTRANLEKARRDEDQWIRAQRESMLQDLAERGTAGGGAEIAGAIGDRAAAADRMSARDLETNAFAQEQALAALGAASEADKTRFGWDRDIATTQMGLGKDATDERYSIAQKLADAGLQSYNTLFGDTVKRSGDAWDALAKGTVPAAETASKTLGDASTEGRANTAGVVSSDTAGTNYYGSGLAGGTGVHQPGSGVTEPFDNPANLGPGQVEGAVGAAGAGADTALGIYEAFAGAGGKDDEDDDG